MFQIVAKPEQILYMGLSTEAKPPASLEQALYLELNTGKVYQVVQGSWQQVLLTGQLSPAKA